jgi:hypothetical protein
MDEFRIAQRTHIRVQLLENIPKILDISPTHITGRKMGAKKGP